MWLRNTQSVCCHYLDTSERIFVSVYASVPRCKNLKAKVFSNKHSPTANFHSARIKISNIMTGRLEGEKKEIRAELRCQSAEVFLVLYYRVFTAVQMCVFVRRWQWTSGPGWRQPSAVWELSNWAVLMVAWRYRKARGMCVWARNSCSLWVMTTYVPLPDLRTWMISLNFGFVAEQAGCSEYPKRTLW